MARGLGGYFASPRRRRRAILFGLAVSAVATIALLIAYARNTAPSTETPLTKGAPVLAPANPKAAPFTKSERKTVLGIARRFLDSGVADHHFKRTWDLITPEMRVGFTRKTWGPDNSTIVPFRYQVARWRFDHSFPNEVGFEIALYPKPNDKDYPSPIVFDMVVTRYPHMKSKPWLVSYWEPAPGQAQVVQSNSAPIKAAAAKPVKPNQLSSVWLVAPAGVFLMILLIPVTLGVREWRRNRRAAQVYESTLPNLSNYTSSSKPS